MSSLGATPFARGRGPRAPAAVADEAAPHAGTLAPAFFLLQFALAISALGYVGFKLRWDLTLGNDPGHAHPHVPEEDYIHDTNSVLSLFMIAFAIDAFEAPLLLLLARCGCTMWLRDALSALCALLEGSAAGSLFVLLLLQHPPTLQTTPPLLANAPPAPPPPHSPVFTGLELAPLFALTIPLALLKIASYTLRIPQRLAPP